MEDLKGPVTETVVKETRENVSKLIQISFAGDADLAVIKTQLIAVKEQFKDDKFKEFLLNLCL